MTPLDFVLREYMRWGVPISSTRRIVPSRVRRITGATLTTVHEDPRQCDKGEFCSGSPNGIATIFANYGPAPNRHVEVVVHDDPDPAELAHELSHAIVFLVTGTPPRSQSELDFVALDAWIIKRSRAGWSRWMKDYGFATGSWHRASTSDRSGALIDSRVWLAARGVMDDDGNPTYSVEQTDVP